jgi:acyl carrier protein
LKGELRSGVFAIIAEIAGGLAPPEIGVCALKDLGIDSLTIVQVLADCEERLGIEIDVETLDLEGVQTPEDLVERLAAASRSRG